MQGLLMKVMAEFLRRIGYHTHVVSYRFLEHSPAENAAVLKQQLASIDTPIVHWVGHSLGGIVILHLLQQHDDLPPGKIVLLGSPVRGSSFAGKIHDIPMLRPLLGRSIEKGLLGGAPEYTTDRPLGIITGSQRFGLGALLFEVEGSDGVVSLSETRLNGITDEVSVPYSHSTMVFSKKCAERVAQFLENSRFD
jgi:pimeloyl-ACP methyl ester carboxylesterase